MPDEQTRRCPFTEPDRLFEDLAAARASDELPWSDALGARVAVVSIIIGRREAHEDQEPFVRPLPTRR